jgi:hypothetical protein
MVYSFSQQNDEENISQNTCKAFVKPGFSNLTRFMECNLLSPKLDKLYAFKTW